MKIVFMDNSNVVLETLQMLMKNCKREVEIFFYKNPLDVKSLIETDKLDFDILFSEVIFNELNGLEFIQNIKNSQKYRDKSVALITKEYDENILNRFKSLGIENIYIKSIYTDHLESFLKDVINSDFKELS